MLFVIDFTLSLYHLVGRVLHVVHVVLEELTSSHEVVAHCLTIGREERNNVALGTYCPGDETNNSFSLRSLRNN